MTFRSKEIFLEELIKLPEKVFFLVRIFLFFFLLYDNSMQDSLMVSARSVSGQCKIDSLAFYIKLIFLHNLFRDKR